MGHISRLYLSNGILPNQIFPRVHPVFLVHAALSFNFSSFGYLP